MDVATLARLRAEAPPLPWTLCPGGTIAFYDPMRDETLHFTTGLPDVDRFIVAAVNALNEVSRP